MRKFQLMLLMTVLQLAVTTYSQPFVVAGARISPTGSILAWGTLRVNGTALPTVVLIDSLGESSEAFNLVIPNSQVIILDAMEADDGIVMGGFIGSGERGEAFIVKLSNGTVKWSFTLQQLYFVKTLAKYGDNYVFSGPVNGVGDSDIATVFTDERATVKRALRIGCPMYDDFVERAYITEGSLILIGSTWCQNVSYVDSLLINTTAESFHLITIGGADRDEGLAAVVMNDGAVLVGSSFTSPGGLSDAYLAVLKGSDLSVLTVGWPSYDGFVDACGNLTDLYLLGYATIEGKSKSLVARVSKGNIVSSLLIESEENIIPLAIGCSSERVITAFKVAEALVAVTFDLDLKPLAAFALGELNVPAVRILAVLDIGKRVYDVSDKWRAQRLNLSPTSIEVSVGDLSVEARPLRLALKPLRIEVGEYIERTPLTRLLVSVIEQNIPLLIIMVPLLAIVLAVIAARRTR